MAVNPTRQPAVKRQAAAESLEITFKPRPNYTEEARRARIEGDVVLEVLFTASGTLRVLRVVRGLGYGLDQNAIEAAAKIRFRPATEDEQRGRHSRDGPNLFSNGLLTCFDSIRIFSICLRCRRRRRSGPDRRRECRR